MDVIVWVAIGVFVAPWIAVSFVVWPFVPCPRCGGKGRWKVAERANFAKRQTKHVYCSVCRATGVHLRWRRRRPEP